MAISSKNAQKRNFAISLHWGQMISYKFIGIFSNVGFNSVRIFVMTDRSKNEWTNVGGNNWIYEGFQNIFNTLFNK